MHALTIHTLPTECRQQGRMRIHDATAIRRHDGCGYQLEVSGKDQQIDSFFAKRLQPGVRSGSIGSTVTGMPRARACARPGASALSRDHQDDLGGSISVDGSKQSLQIAAASRDGHGDPHGHGRGR